jgi:hypothetical protein
MNTYLLNGLFLPILFASMSNEHHKNECEKVITSKIAKWCGIEIKCLSYQVRDISSTLQVGLGTVNKDNLFQQQKLRKNLQYYIHESTRRISKLYDGKENKPKINFGDSRDNIRS